MRLRTMGTRDENRKASATCSCIGLVARNMAKIKEKHEIILLI